MGPRVALGWVGGLWALGWVGGLWKNKLPLNWLG